MLGKKETLLLDSDCIIESHASHEPPASAGYSTWRNVTKRSHDRHCNLFWSIMTGSVCSQHVHQHPHMQPGIIVVINFELQTACDGQKNSLEGTFTRQIKAVSPIKGAMGRWKVWREIEHSAMIASSIQLAKQNSSVNMNSELDHQIRLLSFAPPTLKHVSIELAWHVVDTNASASTVAHNRNLKGWKDFGISKAVRSSGQNWPVLLCPSYLSINWKASCTL